MNEAVVFYINEYSVRVEITLSQDEEGVSFPIVELRHVDNSDEEPLTLTVAELERVQRIAAVLATGQLD